MARAKYFLVKDEHRYQVIKYDKVTGDLKLRGSLRDFKTNIAKATKAGYALVRERAVEPSKGDLELRTEPEAVERAT